MRWTPRGQSSNIEDRRGRRGIGGLGGLRVVPTSLGGLAVLVILSLVFGRDFISGGGQPVGESSGGEVGPVQQSPAEQKEVQFVSFVLDTVQATWASILQRQGHEYRPAELVLFRDATPTGCGVGQTAMGPFYCPVDEKVYIDLGFYDELRDRFGAPGDFAQAYVIAHELGHHVQHLLGTDEAVRREQQANPGEANALSVRVELQADCYAGVWANASNQEQILEPGDIGEGLDAAAAVGDDRIQQQTTGHMNADTFTHGTSAQRTEWFHRGFSSGRPQDCDTFGR